MELDDFNLIVVATARLAELDGWGIDELEAAAAIARANGECREQVSEAIRVMQWNQVRRRGGVADGAWELANTLCAARDGDLELARSDLERFAADMDALSIEVELIAGGAPVRRAIDVLELIEQGS